MPQNTKSPDRGMTDFDKRLVAVIDEVIGSGSRFRSEKVTITFDLPAVNNPSAYGEKCPMVSIGLTITYKPEVAYAATERDMEDIIRKGSKVVEMSESPIL